MADITVTPANVSASTDAKVSRGISGGAIDAGDLVALNASGKVVQADVTDATTHKIIGLAINSTPGSDQWINYITEDPQYACGGTVAIGTVYVLSAAGAFSPAADLTTGDYAAVAGIGRSTSELVVNINSESYVDTAI